MKSNVTNNQADGGETKNLKTLRKIFLVTGYSRSGTTLMGGLLGSSASVFTLAETHYFENMVDGTKIDNILSVDEKLILANRFFVRAHKGILGENAVSADERYLYQCFTSDLLSNYPENVTGSELYLYMLDVLASHYKVSIICEQTGKYLFFVDVFANFGVGLKIFHMIRDPMNVIGSEASKYRVRWLGLSDIPWRETFRVYFSYNPILLTLIIRGFERAFSDVQSKFGNAVIKKIPFESLFGGSESIDMLAQFSGLNDINQSKVEFWGSSVRPEDPTRRVGIVANENRYPSKMSFRTAAGHFWVSVILKNYCDENMYSSDISWKAYFSGLAWTLITPLQLIIIFLLNFRRAPHFLSALGRRLF